MSQQLIIDIILLVLSVPDLLDRLQSYISDVTLKDFLIVGASILRIVLFTHSEVFPLLTR